MSSQVCDNVGDHLIGNVYARYEWETEAQAAVDNLNERWYAGMCLSICNHTPNSSHHQDDLSMLSFPLLPISEKLVVVKTRTANATAGGSAISCICGLPPKNLCRHYVLDKDWSEDLIPQRRRAVVVGGSRASEKVAVDGAPVREGVAKTGGRANECVLDCIIAATLYLVFHRTLIYMTL